MQEEEGERGGIGQRRAGRAAGGLLQFKRKSALEAIRSNCTRCPCNRARYTQLKRETRVIVQQQPRSSTRNGDVVPGVIGMRLHPLQHLRQRRRSKVARAGVDAGAARAREKGISARTSRTGLLLWRP